MNVADVVGPALIFELQSSKIDWTSQFSSLDAGIVGNDIAHGYPWFPSFIYVQCVEIGIPQGCQETVVGIISLGREGGKSLEHKAQVRVIADHPAIEFIAGIDTCGSNVGVVIAQEFQSIHHEWVNAESQAFLAYNCIQTSTHTEFVDEVLSYEPAYVKILAGSVSVNI